MIPLIRNAAILTLASVLAGCGSSGDEEACVPPPKADCSTYAAPTSDGMPASMKGGEAAQAAIDARECGDFVGRPVRALRKAWGTPADNEMIGMGDDSTMVWVRLDGDIAIQVIADYDKDRIVRDIAINREYGDEGSPVQFCGEDQHLPRL